MSVVRYAISVIQIFFYLLFKPLPTNDDLWVFTTYDGTGFAQNAKYQFLYSVRQDDVQAVWVSKEPSVVRMLRDAGYPAYHYSSLKGKYVLFRAGWLFITHTDPFRPYSGNSKIVQLYHACNIKKFGWDHHKSTPLWRRIYKRTIGNDYEYVVVTSSKSPAENAQSAFRIAPDKILPLGYPRNDVLLRDIPDAMLGIDARFQEIFAELRSEGPLVCYMPTWNHGRPEEGQKFSANKIDLDGLERILDANGANLLIKQHPYSSNVIDVREYDCISVIPESLDIYPFLKDVDVLVTDYSSVYCDFLLCNNSIVFYPYDLSSYKRNRGLYYNYSDVAPGPVVKTATDLNHALKHTLSEDQFSRKRKLVREEFHDFENGYASKRIHSHITRS